MSKSNDILDKTQFNKGLMSRIIDSSVMTRGLDSRLTEDTDTENSTQTCTQGMRTQNTSVPQTILPFFCIHPSSLAI